ncbi:MAG: chloramphenicol acetyltransferase [Candidatus Erginobacter occultus]|nr:chloramphenicol acetyltransferase [Candidatus Erginobacter occultus]
MTGTFFIDLEKWERREHYRFFAAMDYPHFNICANLDLTAFNRFRQERNLPFFSTLLYLSSRAANQVKEFRYRIRGEQVIEHETVSPAITVLGDDGTFGYATIEYDREAVTFLERAAETIAQAKANPTIAENPNRDDVIYYTSIPWISFTAFTHPISLPADSIPRISWGKYFAAGDRILLPYSVQVHHGLADGLHVGKHFTLLQSLLDRPAENFSGP